jgi:hypothetical protein
MNDYDGSNYPPPPGPTYKQPSKLGQFILDPKTSVKNYISEALTEPSRPPPPGSYPGGPPPINNYESYSRPNARPPLDAPLPIRPGSDGFNSVSPPPTTDLSSLFPPPGTSGSSSRPTSRPQTPPQPPQQQQNPLRDIPPKRTSLPPHREDSSSSLGAPGNMNDPVARPSSRMNNGYPDSMQQNQYGGGSRVPSPQPQQQGYGPIGGPPPQQMNFHNSLLPPGDMSLPRSMGDLSISQMQQMNGMPQMGQMGHMGQMGQVNMGMRPQSQIMTVATMNQGAPAPKAFHRMVNDYNTLKSGYYMAHIRGIPQLALSYTSLTNYRIRLLRPDTSHCETPTTSPRNMEPSTP